MQMRTKKSNNAASAKERKVHHGDAQPAESISGEDLGSHQASAETTTSHRDPRSSCPSPHEVIARILAERRRGLDRPLGMLARREAELHAQAAAVQTFENPLHKRNPDRKLLLHQVQMATNPSGVTWFERPQMRREAVALCAALRAEDPTDSIIIRQIVAVNNTAMECFARAAEFKDPKYTDVYLRHAERCSMLSIALIEARDRRRNPKQVLVGNVNVGAGGQAIVGNVAAPSQSRATAEPPKQPEPTERNGPTKK